MRIDCGLYKHFKGKDYTVHGIVYDHRNREFVLYQKNYDDKPFWVRPISMFMEEVEVDGQKVKRFNLLNKTSEDDTFANLINLLKNMSIVIFDSETEMPFKIFLLTPNYTKLS